MPVVVTRPLGVASPNACVSRSSSPHWTPPCARAVRRSGSTRIPLIGERSISIASWIAGAEARHAVAAAADGDRKALPTGVANGRDHVGRPGAAGDQPRAAVDHGVVDGACLVVAGAAVRAQLPAEICAQLRERVLLSAGHCFLLSDCDARLQLFAETRPGDEAPAAGSPDELVVLDEDLAAADDDLRGAAHLGPLEEVVVRVRVVRGRRQ